MIILSIKREMKMVFRSTQLELLKGAMNGRTVKTENNDILASNNNSAYQVWNLFVDE